MMLIGMNSWIQSSSSKQPNDRPKMNTAGRNRRGLRAGLAAGLVALALVAGIAHPAETSARKSTSLTCTTLESMFTATSKAYEVARANGLTDQANQYLNTTFWLEGIYLDLDCSSGPANIGDAV
jgi:hypothetical protein